MQPRWNDEVARTLRCSLHQQRRFDLDELVLIHVAVDDLVHTVPQLEDALHPRSAQVEVAVLEPDGFVSVRLIFDWKRRRLGAGDDHELGRLDLDLAGRHRGILGTLWASRDDTRHVHDEFEAEVRS